jgi:hypothetical protein
MSIESALYTDKDVARRINMSPAWVRGQRYKRRHGEPHVFNLDARYVGRSARYVRAEVEAFIASLVEQRQ